MIYEVPEQSWGSQGRRLGVKRSRTAASCDRASRGRNSSLRRMQRGVRAKLGLLTTSFREKVRAQSELCIFESRRTLATKSTCVYLNCRKARHLRFLIRTELTELVSTTKKREVRKCIKVVGDWCAGDFIVKFVLGFAIGIVLGLLSAPAPAVKLVKN